MKYHKLTIFILVSIFIVLSILIFCQEGYDKSLLGVVLMISSFLFVIPFLAKDEERIKSYVFRPFIIFLLGYFIVFFQNYYDLYLGLVSKNDSVFYGESSILYSLLLSCMGTYHFFDWILFYLL